MEMHVEMHVYLQCCELKAFGFKIKAWSKRSRLSALISFTCTLVFHAKGFVAFTYTKAG